MRFPSFRKRPQFDDVVGRSYLERAFAPPKSNYTGAAGIQVDRQLAAEQPAFYIPKGSQVVVDPTGFSGGYNASTYQQPLTDLDGPTGNI